MAPPISAMALEVITLPFVRCCPFGKFDSKSVAGLMQGFLCLANGAEALNAQSKALCQDIMETLNPKCQAFGD